MRVLKICLIVLVFTVLTVNAQNGYIKVRIEVEGNETFKNQTYSYLSRELRDLRDVVIVSGNDYDFYIALIIVSNRNKAGETFGFSMSTLIMESKYCISAVNNGSSIDSSKPPIPESYDSVIKYNLQTGNEDSLRQDITRLVADFDSTALKREREVRKAIERAKTKPLVFKNP